MMMFTFSNFQFIPNCPNKGIWKTSSFFCCIRRVPHLHYLYRFYHKHTIHTWSVCNEMYHNVLRYEYLTFQTQIPLHKQYIFDTDNIQSEYAFLFPFSIFQRTPHDIPIGSQLIFHSIPCIMKPVCVLFFSEPLAMRYKLHDGFHYTLYGMNFRLGFFFQMNWANNLRK